MECNTCQGIDHLMRELDNNVEYNTRLDKLLKLLNEAKQRQDIVAVKPLSLVCVTYTLNVLSGFWDFPTC